MKINVMTDASKQQIAFYRKLYLAYLIDSTGHSVPSLEAETGMPRRTIQDSLKALSDIGVQCEFVPKPGLRHNQGAYCLLNWGPIRAEWVAENLPCIKGALGLRQGLHEDLREGLHESLHEQLHETSALHHHDSGSSDEPSLLAETK